MAKFLVTSGSYFQPFTYDELAKPIMQAVEAHNAAQDVYDTLSTESEALRQYLLQEPEDSRARMMYDSYMNKLDRLQNNLWDNGYNAGTRRDLAAARAGYASDITRLGTAIKDRQNRSKEYWDARHKNPNLVTGADPGLGSLDDYLRDENYGTNWFSYDSAQFEKDVFDETKARAKALYSSLTDPNGVVRNPALKDTLTRVIDKGVTPDEVDAAGVLVDTLIDMSASDRDKFYKTHSDTISPVVQMLTESLINRYDATGIREFDVAPIERQKLINRGKAGLAGGVMEPDIEDFTDPEYEYQMWKRKVDYQNSLTNSSGNGSGSSSGSGSGNKSKRNGTYSIQTLATYLDSPDAKKLTSTINDKFVDKYEQPIPVTGINGTPDVIESPYDAQRILDDMGRQYLLNTYGVDPSTGNPAGNYDLVDGDGNKHRLSVQNSSGYAGNSNGPFTLYYDGKYDKSLSEDFTKDYRTFRASVDEWKSQNPGVDIFNLAISEKDWGKLYKDLDAPSNVPREAIPAIMATKAGIGYRTPAYLATDSSDDGMKKTRQDFAAKLYSSYVHSDKDNKGRVAKTSDVVVYRVSADGSVLEEVRDMRKVLGVNSSDEIKTDTIHDITASPEDVIDNKIRFTATNGNYEYSTNPVVFGNTVANAYRDMRKPVYEYYDDNTRETLDSQGVIHYMMKPIVDPVSVFSMSDEQKKKWTLNVAEALQDYMDFYATDDSGKIVDVITPESVVARPELRELLRNAVVRYINDELGSVRDANNQGQMFKATATNPGAVYDMGLTNSIE